MTPKSHCIIGSPLYFERLLELSWLQMEIRYTGRVPSVFNHNIYPVMTLPQAGLAGNFAPDQFWKAVFLLNGKWTNSQSWEWDICQDERQGWWSAWNRRTLKRLSCYSSILARKVLPIQKTRPVLRSSLQQGDQVHSQHIPDRHMGLNMHCKLGVLHSDPPKSFPGIPAGL